MILELSFDGHKMIEVQATDLVYLAMFFTLRMIVRIREKVFYL
jgi:hypothetical protein